MTASTPRASPPSLPFPSSATAFNHGTPTVDQTTEHLNGLDLGHEKECPPGFPSAFVDNNDIPMALSLPLLAPRATKQRRRELSETSATLMDFVTSMSIGDVRSAAQSFSHRPPLAEYSTTSFLDMERPPLEDSNASASHSSMEATTEETSLRALNSVMPSNGNTIPWSLTTPETTKVTISTPHARRSVSQKRKSPMLQLHSTPVDGNRPLMIPTLATIKNTPRLPSTTFSRNSHTVQGGRKKAKNCNTLLTSAPMLPTSPDLEHRDRAMAAPRRAPYTSPPVGGVTMVNPNFIRQMAPPTPATPQTRRALPLPTAGLPSLDEVERSQPKWLRMKRRHSLLCALRLAATES
ncbi:expressed unknown protein [Seminavis robusta]|uniref:Uncharacterized protein n=1 Tax=Seminavis robusta TaxID=568900 RepID=A0A9N8F2W4_9STRA|nr:expressed unknown protein [Seminavis robusta]|eukprot:Sro2821_g337930.1 n/a (351) ;mRNA; f:7318-8370